MSSIELVWNDFLSSLKGQRFPRRDLERIIKAWNFCKLKHGNQLRKSGQLYIIHPLLTSKYLFEWKMDANSIIAGLLHDVLEDTNTSEKEIEELFGSDVLSLVSGVTKVSTISNENRSGEIKRIFDNDESLMKILLSISSDIRIITIKLADRLHNMSTIRYLNPDKQKSIAKETFDIYANIAGRIGMYDLKTKLLDLSFSILYPNEFLKTEKYIEYFLEKTKKKVDEFNINLIKLLKNNNIDIELKTRIKGVYSTNKKMQSENIAVKDIYDIYASRIIVKGNELDCYKILGIVHLNYTSLPKRFKDYISKPKLNLYQSLHTIILYEGIYIELQIRNREMDDIAIYGLAAHWKYKENKQSSQEVITTIVKQVETIKKDESSKQDNLTTISKNKFFDVLVLNDNKWYIADETQSILDIAYKVNSRDFLRISSITRDYKRSELSRKVKPGSIIEINYSSKIKATPDWIDWCSLVEAKDTINSYFLEIKNENDKIIEDFIMKVRLKLKNECATEDEIRARVISLGFKSLSDFINFLVAKKINFLNPDITNFCLNTKYKWKISQSSKRIRDFYQESQKKSNFYFKELDGVFYKRVSYPKCCSKAPGIECVGILEKMLLVVHKYNCPDIPKNRKQIVLHWDQEKLKNDDKIFNCSVAFEIHKNISNKILNSIIDFGFKIVELKTKQISNEKIELITTLNILNLEQVQFLIDEIKIKYLVPNIRII
ncbi:MAG: RelA/SpoT family protein [Mycoplasmoidaceae bacterium]